LVRDEHDGVMGQSELGQSDSPNHAVKPELDAMPTRGTTNPAHRVHPQVPQTAAQQLHPQSQAHIDALFDAIDVNNDGVIDATEFAAAVLPLSPHAETNMSSRLLPIHVQQRSPRSAEWFDADETHTSESERPHSTAQDSSSVACNSGVLTRFPICLILSLTMYAFSGLFVCLAFSARLKDRYCFLV